MKFDADVPSILAWAWWFIRISWWAWVPVIALSLLAEMLKRRRSR